MKWLVKIKNKHAPRIEIYKLLEDFWDSVKDSEEYSEQEKLDALEYLLTFAGTTRFNLKSNEMDSIYTLTNKIHKMKEILRSI